MDSSMDLPMTEKWLAVDITIPPRFLTSSLFDYVRHRATFEFENKCLSQGYVRSVETLHMGECKTLDQTRDGAMTMRVRMKVMMYEPAKQQELTCVVTSKDARLQLVLSESFPLLITITNRAQLDAYAGLQVGDTVRVRVDDFRIMGKSKPIRVVATFLDIKMENGM